MVCGTDCRYLLEILLVSVDDKTGVVVLCALQDCCEEWFLQVEMHQAVPAADSEVPVAMAPLVACSSVNFLGVCGLIAAQPCCLQMWERVVQLGLTEDTVAAVAIMQCQW